MKDYEKQFDNGDDVLSRHTAEYNLTVSMSNPQLRLQTEKSHELKKALEARHLSMIAIGGALGTGLLIGTGSALKSAGPGAVFITYSLVGFVVFMVLSALGEVATFIPLADGFAGYCTRYVDEALGFACGWVYLFKYLLIPANQLVAWRNRVLVILSQGAHMLGTHHLASRHCFRRWSNPRQIGFPFLARPRCFQRVR